MTFDKKAIDIIVDKAMEFKLGARGLRSICEAIMLDAMFEFPSDESKKELEDYSCLCKGTAYETFIHETKSSLVYHYRISSSVNCNIKVTITLMNRHNL